MKRMAEKMNSNEGDDETTMIVKRLAVLRIATKHINIWIRHLETKRKEICELAWLMKFEEIKKEILNESPLKDEQKVARTTSPRR